MRIGLDARYLYDHFPGIGRYIAALAEALAELEHAHTLVIIHNPALASTRHSLGHLAGRRGVELAASPARPFSAGEQLAIPRLARRLGLDLLHSPYYLKPYLGLPCPSVVTIYDVFGLRYPRMLSPRGRLLYRAAMGMAVRTSAAILTISEHARQEIRFSYRVPWERVVVTPLAADRRFRPASAEEVAALRGRLGLPASYVLYLGSNKPHKNLERLVRAWGRLQQEGKAGGAQLVIAGHYDPAYPEARRLVEEGGLAASVQFLPNVAEADLPALYSGATVFAFPSIYEGFGLPPLEAMACGAPVLCAYASSLPEVVGNAALTVDPFSFIEIAEGLGRLLANPGLRRRMSEAGLLRAREFSWRRTALATLRAYEGAARAPAG